MRRRGATRSSRWSLRALRTGATSSGSRCVSGSLHELVVARVTAVPKDARTALLAAAALGDPTLELIDAVTGGDAAAALEPAVQGELVALDAGRVRFTHPLLAAAAYSAVGPAERRDVHAALASRVRDPEERARHLALAARWTGCSRRGRARRSGCAGARPGSPGRSRGAARTGSSIDPVRFGCRGAPPGRRRSQPPLRGRRRASRTLSARRSHSSAAGRCRASARAHRSRPRAFVRR